jgi:hypothetical protein
MVSWMNIIQLRDRKMSIWDEVDKFPKEDKMKCKDCDVELKPHFPPCNTFGVIIHADWFWCPKCGLMYHELEG